METLKERLEVVFSSYRLKNEGGLLVPLNFYLQNLPAPKRNDDTPIFPHVVIRFEQSRDEGYETAYADVLFIAGVFDDDSEYQGYQDVMSILEKIRQEFLRDHMADGRFWLEFPLTVLTSDDFSASAYPYFFGVVESKWRIPVMTQNLEWCE
jgi:hypothetical protein